MSLKTSPAAHGKIKGGIGISIGIAIAVAIAIENSPESGNTELMPAAIPIATVTAIPRGFTPACRAHSHILIWRKKQDARPATEQRSGISIGIAIAIAGYQDE